MSSVRPLQVTADLRGGVAGMRAALPVLLALHNPALRDQLGGGGGRLEADALPEAGRGRHGGHGGALRGTAAGGGGRPAAQPGTCPASIPYT